MVQHAKAFTASPASASISLAEVLMQNALAAFSEAEIARLEADIARFERTGMATARILKVFSSVQGVEARIAA
jgi:hypothetical protein